MLFIDMLIVGGLVCLGSQVYDAFKKEKNVTKQKPSQRKPPSKREEQLQVLVSDPEYLHMSEEEEHLEDYLKISSGLVALTLAGRLFHPFLSFLSLPGFFYFYRPVFVNAYNTFFKKRKLTMDAIDAIVIAVTVGTGYFFEAALMTWLYFQGVNLVRKTQDRTRQKLINVFADHPTSVWIAGDGVELEIPFEELRGGDTLVVNAGHMIAADGRIVKGLALIDQHILTGESQLIEKGLGEQVFASTVALSGRIWVHVEQSGQDTVTAKIGEILNNTADFKTSLESKALQQADRSVLPMLAGSAVSLPFLGVLGAVSLLNTDFGYSARFLSPISMLNFLDITSQHGILVKDGRSLERLKDIDTVVFDKTGTLTLAQPQVEQIHTYNGFHENEILRYAATAELRQNHPLAGAILQEANRRHLQVYDIEDAHYEMGFGMKVHSNDGIIRVGSRRFMENEGIALPTMLRDIEAFNYDLGNSLVHVAVGNELSGTIELHPTVRPEARHLVDMLRQRKMSLSIISGDHEKPTRRLAQQLRIDRYFANTLPQEKAQHIEQFRKEGRCVCFIGDGINDAIALRTADVSISLRGASTVATDAAQIIFMNERLDYLGRLFEIADDFDVNQKNCLRITYLSGIVGVGGVLLLNFRIIATTVVGTLGAFVGIGNAMLPKLTYHPKEQNNS